MIPALLWRVFGSALRRNALAKCTLGPVEGPILFENLADANAERQLQVRNQTGGCANSGPSFAMNG